MAEKYLKMIENGGSYPDLVAESLRGLLGFMEDREYVILAKLVTGVDCQDSRQATEALVNNKVPERYFGPGTMILYRDDPIFRTLVDNLVKCEGLREDIMKELMNEDLSS